jgi:glycosyltransferase involved in cell wall biosynthesis
MKIALVLGTSTGGIGANVRDLAAAAVDRGDRVLVLGPEQAGLRFGFAATGARFFPVEIAATVRDGANVRALWLLRRHLAAARVDIVHAHGIRAAAMVRLALVGRGTPSVVTLHNAMPVGGRAALARTLLEKFAVTGASVVLGASGDLVERARALGARDMRFGPVPAPQRSAPTQERSRTRAALGVSDRQQLLLAIGRLAPQKDYPLLLDAFARCDTAAEKLLLIAGDGPMRAELQAVIDRRGLDARLLGSRTDIAELLDAADILVLSSRWEARALVIQEAMAAGVPVLATAVGGIPELVGDAAVLVPWGDPVTYARALAALIDDPDARSRLATAGLAQAVTWPTPADCFALIAAVYAEVAAAC